MSQYGETYDVTITDDSVRFHGVDWGTGVEPLDIHHQRGDILVLKIPGHNAWQDRLHPSVYEPAAFMVVRILHLVPGDKPEPEPHRATDAVEFITIFPIRKGAGTW